MNRLNVLVACGLAAFTMVPARAGSVSFTGNFTNDDDLQFFDFNVSGSSAVTLETLSYGGGTNAAGTVIPAGGFEPVLSLFASSDLLIGASGPNGVCPPQNPDPTTGLCADAYIHQTLAPGTYTLALTEFFNVAIGPDLSDGFLEQGQSNFTGASCGSPGSSFFDETCTQRTGAWAVDLLGVQSASATAPEPSSIYLTLFGGAVVVAMLRRRTA